MNIIFDDLDIDLGNGYFIKYYEVVPEVRLEDSSFTAETGHGDVVVDRFDPHIEDMNITAMYWGDEEGGILHCWPDDSNKPPRWYFEACCTHALKKENEERILDHWTCENA